MGDMDDKIELIESENPFTCHDKCNHPEFSMRVKVTKNHAMDLWQMLKALDKQIRDGELVEARAVLWGMGYFLLTAVVDQERAEMLADSAIALNGDLDAALQGLIDKG